MNLCACGCGQTCIKTWCRGHRCRRQTPIHARTHRSWESAKTRCFNPNHHSYDRYGGAGITMCDRWHKSYDAFFADMGERPDGTTLDRYPDKNGNYEPGNCRWATALQQGSNQTSNRVVIYLDVEMSVSEAVRAAGSIVKKDVACRRLDAGWSAKDAVETPSIPISERRWAGIGDRKRAANAGARS